MAWARLLNGSNGESPSPQSSPVKGEEARGRVRPSIRAGEAPALLGVNGLCGLNFDQSPRRGILHEGQFPYIIRLPTPAGHRSRLDST